MQSGDFHTTALLVDDQPLVRRGMKAVLASQGIAVIGEASRAGQGLQLARELRPDVVVLAMDRLGPDGVALTREVCAMPLAPAVLAIAVDGSASALDALLAGARGLLLGDCDPQDLADGIRAAAAGQVALAPSVALGLVQRLRELELERQVRQATGHAAPSLTQRETEVLRLVADGRDNSAIGEALFISAGTVKHHVQAIFAKLGASNRAQAAAQAVRFGLA